MVWTQILLLLAAGLAAGFVAGLIGVGGGIIFAPVLFFYFRHTGIGPEVIDELTLGSSLFCTFLAASASAFYQYRERAVLPRIALSAGVFSVAAVFLTARYITTTAWYDAEAFQVVFSCVLLIVVGRMVWDRRRARKPKRSGGSVRRRWPLLAATGTAAGAISSAAGVGGGVVLVPAYDRVLGLPIRRATGTSSATIVLISLGGVVSYAFTGWGASVPATALGYVDVGHALLLAVPALVSARAGVYLAHRIDTWALRWSFALIALFVAGRMIYGAF